MKKPLLAAVLIASTVSSQITITSSDIPHNVGDWTVSTGDSVSEVNVGHEGGPQHWEFQLVNPCVAETTYIVSAGNSPALDSFPATNLLYQTAVDDTLKMTSYAHSNLSDAAFSSLGRAFVIDTPFTITTMVYHPPDTVL